MGADENRGKRQRVNATATRGATVPESPYSGHGTWAQCPFMQHTQQHGPSLPQPLKAALVTPQVSLLTGPPASTFPPDPRSVPLAQSPLHRFHALLDCRLKLLTAMEPRLLARRPRQQ